MFHVAVHVRGDLSLTTGALDEELDQFQQGLVPVVFVGLYPFVNHSLQTSMNSFRQFADYLSFP